MLSIIHTSSLKDWTRAKQCLASFLLNVPTHIIRDYFLIVPKRVIDKDAKDASQIKAKVCGYENTKFNISCIDEVVLLNQNRSTFYKSNRLGSDNDGAMQSKSIHHHPTWGFQMALKIYSSLLVQTEFFIIVDSDVFLLRSLDVSWLLPETNNKPRARVVRSGTSRHHAWYEQSNKFLKANGCLLNQTKDTDLGIGVTPAVLHTDTWAAIVPRLNVLYGGSAKALDKLLRGGYTEYTLYLTQSTCVQKDFDKHHSYWTPTPMPRLYDGIWGGWDNKKWKAVLKSNATIESFINATVFVVLQDHVYFDESDVSKLLKGRIQMTSFL